ncbi:Ig-like domain-containing protein [Hyalangium rubrum]|uniref:Ig-like domain-containing protein n=1 Tax=Hyalangium rubrum TaxID=3103134 RepID=A0ABU5HH31_9BACT|nr:Ig-like domain-containing protein [Hyalangium sp. s54d21]MDY7231400.1 Ig-like domain-containing protein [Hyalangium sp. s54d21]
MIEISDVLSLRVAPRKGWLALLCLGVWSAACSPETPVSSEATRAPAPVAVSGASLVGVDGNYTVTTANEQLNRYTTLAANVAAGATTLQVSSRTELDSPQFGTLAAGDLLMIIQMQGATIDTADAAGYGAVTALNGAGLYELVTVASTSNGAGATLNINLNTTGCSGLRNAYVASSTQVVRVPQLASLTVNAGASVVATAWDGTKGGVLALQVQNTLNLNGTLDASARGFRGGAADNAGSAMGTTTYRTPDATLGAEKGEGIAGYQDVYDGLNGRYGRGAAANGGGGGDAHNGGGGGGANGNNGNLWTGQGVMRGTVTGAAAWALDPGYIDNGNARTNASGGGRGGYTYSSSNQNALTLGPGQATWGGDSRREAGGLGARPVANDPGTRLFLGGGGGAGDGNNAAAGRGGNGGGLVWVVADTVTGTGSIAANGAQGTDTIPGHNDAPGGGGAGGTVMVSARALSGITLNANGGRGGNQLITSDEAEGPGGGGGGGYIAVAGGVVTRNVAGGLSGTSTSAAVTEFPVNGATDGAAGQLGAAVATLPLCLPSDLAITLTDGVTSVVPGSTVTYTLTVTNNGPNAVTGAAVTDTFPAALTGVTWTCAPAAACATTSGTGNIAGALLTLGSGGTATFTVTATVNPAAVGTLSNTATVAPPRSNTDPTPANNSATDTDTLTPRADMSVTLTDAPDPVDEDATLTYTLTVTNAGPSASSSVTATLSLQAGVTYVSATGTGWTCNQSAGVVTCTRPTAAPGAVPGITVQVTAPAVGGTVTATAAVSASTTDPVSGNNSASQTTTVTNVNDPPNAVDDAAMVNEDSGTTVVDVLVNDTFAPDVGETLTVTAVTQPATGGTVTLSGGVVRFTPAANFSGTVTFTYTISDGNGGTDTATVTVTVKEVNDPPDAVNDTLTVGEDSTATVVNVLANDTFAPDVGELLTVTAVTQPATGGTVTLSGGVVRFTPAANFSGTATFTYTISDGRGGTDTATVTVTVTEVNDPPDAVNDAVTVAEDSAATVVDVLVNDTIAPDVGETLTVTAVTQPATGGTVALTVGVVRFTPAANFAGTTTFTYTVSDGRGGTDTATVTVTVTEVNDPPDAVNDTLTVAEDSGATVVNVLANDTFAPDTGETLTVTAVTQPATGGTVTLTGGVVSFTPAANFAGTTTFTYTLSDGRGGTDTATVTVTVTEANDPPDAVNDAVTVAEDSAATVVDVLANDSFAPDTGETLTVTAVTQPATGGTVTLSGGVVRFTPTANFSGTATFTYTISDGRGGTDTATVTVTVTDVNDAPDAVNDSFTVAENSTNNVLDVLTNDSFAPDVGETLTVTSVTQPASGTVTLTGGTVRYTPPPSFNGTVTFSYTVSDGRGGTDTATVTVMVAGTNDPPTANDDILTVAEDSVATVVDVLANDTFAPDTGETLTVTSVTQPATGGTVTLVGGVVSFTPAANFAGIATFTYTISDGNGGTDTATVTVTVTELNDVPDAVNDAVTVAEDSAATVVDVLANDTFAPDVGETLTVTSVTQPATGGTVTLTGGVVRFTPAANFAGTVTFTYTISDGRGGTDIATVTVTVTEANDPPDAVNDAVTVAEDSGATVVDVLANDTFAPDVGETLTVTAVTQPATGGTVTLSAGVVRFTPATNFAGTTTFTYTVSDGRGGTDTATVTVTVTDVNDAPDAVNDAITVAEDSAATVVDVLSNDTFAPDVGETLTVTAVTQPATGGTVTLSGGVVRFTPAANFSGTATFTYTVSDGRGGTDTATVTVTVTDVNDAPDAVDDAVTVAEDSGATVVTVLANDTFAPDTGETLTVATVTQPATGGTVSLTGGVVRFTPTANFAGTTTFTYTISDGRGGTDTATVTVTVTDVNDAPVANDDTVTVAEDSGATVVTVLANDTFAPDVGETLTVTAVTQPATGGTVTLTGGVVSFTPANNFVGTTTFTYTVSDGRGGTDTATVTVTVTEVNDPPDAVDDAVTVAEDSAATIVTVLTNDTITPDAGETLTVTAVTQATHGTVTLAGGVVRYQPEANFYGTDTFTYTVSDGRGGTDTATVTVTVTEVNDPPSATNDSFTVAENSTNNVLDVLINDTFAPDPGETLTVTGVTQPANGTVTLTGGVVRYTPPAGFFGSVTFTYTVSDGRGGTDTGTVTVVVSGTNDPPTANDDTLTVGEDSAATVVNVLANDTFAPDENETLTVTAVTQPAHGTVTLISGTVSYQPEPNFAGIDTFLYTISDGNGGTDTATVTVTVTPVNDAPGAVDDTLEVSEDSAATVVDVLANDTIAPDDNETLTVTAVSQPANGTVTLVDGVVSYQPDANFFGTDTFTYTITDSSGGMDTATVTVTVTEVNDPPTGVADSFSLAAGSGAATLDVLANDSIAPDVGETLTVTAVTQPATGGTAAVAPDGSGVVFTPAPGFTGIVTLTYTVSDSRGGTAIVTVTVDVGAVNTPPTANDDSLTVDEDSTATVVNVLANDTAAPDVGETLTVTAVTQPTHGTVTLTGGVVRYQPEADFFGTDTFTYTISDGNGGTDTATVTVTVSEVNDPPAAANDVLTVSEDSVPTVVDVLANDTFAPDVGETLTVIEVTQPANGTVTLVGGVVSYQPNPNFFGTDTFSYTVSDGNGGTATATVTVTVSEVNDPPTGVEDIYAVPMNSGAATLDVLANDSIAPDVGETLTVTAVTQPTSGGSVTVAPDGSGVVFTPESGFSGPVTFTYTVSDGRGGTDTVTVTVNVVTENSPPTAVDDAITVAEDSGTTVVSVLANDSTEPDTGETLTVTAVTQPTGGTVTLVGGVVSFTPAANFFGVTTFTYTVSDGNGGTDTATVTVTVSEVNDPPTGVADTFSVAANSSSTPLNVLANDSSAPDANETLTVTAVTQPAEGGTVSIPSDGSGVVFTPSLNFIGTLTFTYTVSDGNGGSTTVTVTVNVGLLDSDNDGIDDITETELGLDPNDADSDDDGVSDGEDGITDSDDDGLIDALDPDSDNDGLNDGTERGVTNTTASPGTDLSSPNFQPDSDPSTTTDPRNPDTDGDGLKDGTEDANHDGRVGDTESDPNDPDTDDGGLNDGDEVSAGGDPRNYADDLAVAGRGCASTGAGTLLPLALLLALPLLRRRRGAVGTWGLLGVLAAVLFTAPVSAQTLPASQDIDVQQYKPGPGLKDVLGVHSPRVGKHLGWNLGLSFNYAKDPLNFLNPRTDTFVYEIVKNQFTFDLMGAIALFDRVELGVALPITSQGSGSGASVAPVLPEGVDATGVGDLRLVPKVNLLSTDSGLHLGLAVPLMLPTSGGKEFLGRSGLAVYPRVLGEWSSDGGTRVLANVGLNLQPKEQLYNLNVGNELAYGLGTEIPFQMGRHRLAAEATLVGALGLKQSNTEERPLEVLAALKYRFSDALAAHLGGGPGITRGYGTPGFRLFAGVIWTETERALPARIEAPPPAPACPQGPEDVDGFQDEDGCADPDNDGDGLLDVSDRCPNQPETKNSFEDEDGCPDEVPPPPPVDTDGDNLTDDQDRCPAAAEDMDGFEDTDGCPDLDNDRDSVADESDKCPTAPETINGVQDEDGCPDKGEVKVLVEGQRIVILDKVYFATNKDVILARSFSLLQQVAAVLRANPQLTKVRVEGHTDSQGADAKNQDLSQRRANSVRKRLIETEGIAPERLEAVGYGETKPVDTNDTAKGRENNRRVEFTILETKAPEEEIEAH